jgi:hypothetical protein
MAAGHAFLTQVSARAWKCSECPLTFDAEDADALDRMLDRFMHHVRKMHTEEGEGEGATKWKPRRRRRPRTVESDPDLTVTN